MSSQTEAEAVEYLKKIRRLGDLNRTLERLTNDKRNPARDIKRLEAERDELMKRLEADEQREAERDEKAIEACLEAERDETLKRDEMTKRLEADEQREVARNEKTIKVYFATERDKFELAKRLEAERDELLNVLEACKLEPAGRDSDRLQDIEACEAGAVCPNSGRRVWATAFNWKTWRETEFVDYSPEHLIGECYTCGYCLAWRKREAVQMLQALREMEGVILLCYVSSPERGKLNNRRTLHTFQHQTLNHVFCVRFALRRRRRTWRRVCARGLLARAAGPHQARSCLPSFQSARHARAPNAGRADRRSGRGSGFRSCGVRSRDNAAPSPRDYVGNVVNGWRVLVGVRMREK